MAVYARGNGFQVKLMLSGELIRAQFSTRADAEAYEADVRAAFARGLPLPKAGAGSAKAGRITDLGELYEHAVTMHWKSKKSGDHMARLARLYVQHVGPRTSLQTALALDTIHAYVRHRMDEKQNSSATINRHLAAISVLANKVAAPLSLIPGKLDLPWQTEGKGRLRYYSVSEEQSILEMLSTWEQWDFADLFIWLADTGARLGETEDIRWTDIRANRITFDATTTKNGKTRTITATPRVLSALSRLAARHPGTRGPFQWLSRRALRHVWSRLRARLGWMDDTTVIHTYRHTCASRLAMSGASEVQIARWMGHTSTATTQRYMHLSPSTFDDLAFRLDSHRAGEASRAAVPR